MDRDIPCPADVHHQEKQVRLSSFHPHQRPGCIMGIFEKMFGKRDPLAQLRRDFSQQNWAAAFNAVCLLDRSQLSTEEQAEIADIEVQAGDRLAELNLFEGEGEVRNGRLVRAREHFQLACQQARSPELQQRAEASMVQLDLGGGANPGKDSVGAAASCVDCGPAASPGGVMAGWQDDDLDDDSRFEVLLATLPEKQAERYLETGPAFRRAWLASQGDDPQRALTLFEEVPESERDSLYYSERGNLKGRCGEFEDAHADLSRALHDEPGLFVALSGMVELLAAGGHLEAVEQLLRKTLTEGRFQGYCWANLAQLHAQRGEDDQALDLASRALGTGRVDQASVLLCARILEDKERFPEAEAMLAKLPAGGCGGGAHPLLAEFWLRRGQHLDKSLETFKAALRQEPGNPRWVLRIAQVYLARGWHSEAAAQIDRLLDHDGLDDELRREVRATTDQLRT